MIPYIFMYSGIAMMLGYSLDKSRSKFLKERGKINCTVKSHEKMYFEGGGGGRVKGMGRAHV